MGDLSKRLCFKISSGLRIPSNTIWMHCPISLRVFIALSDWLHIPCTHWVLLSVFVFRLLGTVLTLLLVSSVHGTPWKTTSALASPQWQSGKKEEGSKDLVFSLVVALLRQLPRGETALVSGAYSMRSWLPISCQKRDFLTTSPVF